MCLLFCLFHKKLLCLENKIYQCIVGAIRPHWATSVIEQFDFQKSAFRPFLKKSALRLILL